MTIEIPLSDNSKRAIQEHLLGKDYDKFIFTGQKSHYTRKPISTNQYQRIIKSWMRMIGTEDVSGFSSHSIRKSKASLLYSKTNNVVPSVEKNKSSALSTLSDVISRSPPETIDASEIS